MGHRLGDVSLLHFVRGNSSWARVDPKDGAARVLGPTVGKITKDERTNESAEVCS